jgi:hypothetical protein
MDRQTHRQGDKSTWRRGLVEIGGQRLRLKVNES